MTESRWIDWRCDLCQDPLADGDYATVDENDVQEVRRARADLEERTRHPEFTGVHIYSGQDFGTLPPPARWLFRHHRCDPQPDSPDYSFDIANIRTEGALLAWSAHLMDKNWLDATNWQDVMRLVADGRI